MAPLPTFSSTFPLFAGTPHFFPMSSARAAASGICCTGPLPLPSVAAPAILRPTELPASSGNLPDTPVAERSCRASALPARLVSFLASTSPMSLACRSVYCCKAASRVRCSSVARRALMLSIDTPVPAGLASGAGTVPTEWSCRAVLLSAVPLRTGRAAPLCLPPAPCSSFCRRALMFSIVIAILISPYFRFRAL